MRDPVKSNEGSEDSSQRWLQLNSLTSVVGAMFNPQEVLNLITMGSRTTRTGQGQIHWWGTVCSLVLFFVSGTRWLVGILRPPLGGHPFDSLGSLSRLQTILFLGVGAAVLHGILWIFVERACKWTYKEGESLPRGWPAVVLSLTMTIPLVSLPPLYARLTDTQIVPEGYLLPAFLIIVCSAAGHIILYGTDAIRFIGIRNIIFPLDSPPSRIRAVGSEIAYASIHFGSIVFVYRLVTESRAGPLSLTVFFPALISALVWLSSVCVFIFVYPASVTQKGGMELRGVLNGLMLCITLLGGMLM
jgi:hypothetical protein